MGILPFPVVGQIWFYCHSAQVASTEKSQLQNMLKWKRSTRIKESTLGPVEDHPQEPYHKALLIKQALFLVYLI